MPEIALQILLRILVVLALVYVGLGLLLFFIQGKLLYYPEVSDPLVCQAFERSGVTKMTQGETLMYYKKNGEALVVFYHGNGGKACDRLFLAQFLDSQKISYLFVEYAGYGDGRRASQKLLEQNTRDADVFLKTLSFDALTFMGESLGTALAASHATLRPPDKIILVTPYIKISDVATAHFPYNLYPVSLLLKDNFDTEAIAQYKNELLIIHGREDEIIPLEQGARVYELAPSMKKKFVRIQAARHNDLYDFSEVWQELEIFLKSS